MRNKKKTVPEVSKVNPGLNDAMQQIAQATHHDPFSVLGRHIQNNQTLIRAFSPHTTAISISGLDIDLERVGNTDFFEWTGHDPELPDQYQFEYTGENSQHWKRYDPYSFPVCVSDLDIHLFIEGKHRHTYHFMGATPKTINGIEGIQFVTWAPNAGRVSVIGNFNGWDGRIHQMRVRGSSGLWELFIPALPDGEYYKFEIRNRDSGNIHVKSDPYARYFEMRPATSSVVTTTSKYEWQDDEWLRAREKADWLKMPMSTYEVHPASWQRDEYGNYLNYRELAHRLVKHVCELGFTHIELLPLTEHPLDQSWGYQTIGYFAITSRFGTPDDFRYFVDYCHQNGISVIMDWVPGHFPKDDFALARFDGSALYEHADPRIGEHKDWGTLIFNYGRAEVKNFLISSATYWLDEFHIDGLRVDAVASMLYLDYAREAGEWIPNRYGGNENLDAIDFLRELNEVTHGEYPGTVTIAEESTSWPQVTRPGWLGGLGFSMKWNMGWMHDSLDYMEKDPVHRHYHHDLLTFGLMYAFTENFVLPFSHDEVVHLKGSMLHKMPGDDWQRFANLRLLYTFMWTYPGKKLLFMGSEFGQENEWDSDQPLDWYLTNDTRHSSLQWLIRDLNKLYKETPSLSDLDFNSQGFEWIDCHDATQSTISYLRRSGSDFSLVILNFTPVPRENYRVGVPEAGIYHEVFNSDSRFYSGSDMGNGGDLQTDDKSWMGRPYSIQLTIPPLAGLIIRRISK